MEVKGGGRKVLLNEHYKYRSHGKEGIDSLPSPPPFTPLPLSLPSP